MFVLKDVYDATNERALIVEGSQISGPMEVRIADGQVSLTIAGNYFREHGWVVGCEMRGHLIEPRTRIGECLWVAANPEEWRADILRNPVLSATLLFTDMDDADESDSSKARFSRDAEGQLHLHLPVIFELTVRRPLFFSSPPIRRRPIIVTF